MNNNIRASILGVGSELTSGQISNGNATWLSHNLKALGLLTQVHLVVPDHKKLILDGLQFCASESDLIFITGGLGPTSDDFTRDLISLWSNLEMEFDAETWSYIQQRLLTRGIPAEDFQKQQCYFPKSAKILKNFLGTAHGFYLFAHNKHLFALPGPPREIEALWNEHIHPWLAEFTKNLDPHITLSWDILGKSEGELAKITESILTGSGLEIGYRVHMPYVEVKISFFQSDRKNKEKYIHSLDQVLSPIVVTRHGEDIANLFCEKLLHSNQNIQIHDEVSSGYLLHRLQTPLKTKGLWKHKKINYTTWTENLPITNIETGLFFKLELIDQLTAKASWRFDQSKGEELFTSPYPQANLEERRFHYFAEKAMMCWNALLK